MRIKEIILFTSKISEQLFFYKNVLCFEIISENESSFSIQVGFTQLIFQLSEENHQYHYCFLIPSNQLNSSIKFLKERLEIIQIEKERIIEKYEDWNAESIYFYDGAGNLAEFIVRFDLKNETDDEGFNIKQIICLNEIGMPVKDIKLVNENIEKEMNSYFWKGNFNRFGTNGTQEGLFLLVNEEEKQTWFPTSLKIKASPFFGIFESEEKLFQIEYKNREVNIEKKT